MPQIPFAQQWPIGENQLLPLQESEKGCLLSTYVSNIPEFEYYLAFYPNGDEETDRGKTRISLYLELKNVKKVAVDFTVTIDSANFSKPIHYIYEKSCGHGSYICETDEFFDPEKKFIVDGKFTVKINGIFKFEIEDAVPAAIEQKWCGGELGDECWDKNETKDFTIITAADGNELKVHKIVLDVRSEFFEAMIKSNMKEAAENKVTIPDFSFNVVETAFKIVYDINFTSSLSIDELIELQQFFDKYLLPKLKAKVEPFLIAQISAATVCRLTNWSILTNSFKLKGECMSFLSVAFQLKTPLADFDDLDKDVLFQLVKNSFYGTLETREQ